MSAEQQTLEQEMGFTGPHPYLEGSILIAGREFQVLPPAVKRKRAACQLGKSAVLQHEYVSFDPEATEPTHSAFLARLAIADSGDAEVDNFHHSVRVTEPIEPRKRSSTSIWLFPGFAETTETGVGRVFHDTVASQLPSHRVYSVASTGVGGIGDHVGFFNASRHARMKAMAKQRADLMQAVDKKRRPKIVISTSMGTVITREMLETDIVAGNKLNIAGVALYAPAWLESQNGEAHDTTQFKLLGKIFPEVLVGISPFGALKETAERKTARRDLLSNSFHLKDIPAMVQQVRDLRIGVPLERMDHTLKHYPTVVIVGENDPLAKVWRSYAERTHEFPNLRVVFIDKAGHGMAAFPRAGAEKTIRELRNSHILGQKAVKAA